MATLPSLSYLVGSLVLFYVAYITGYGIYSLFFHPLKRFPGPKYLAVSRLPITLARLTGKSVHLIHEAHIRYGDIVRVAPDELSFINPEAWKEMYGHRTGGTTPLPKHPVLYGVNDNGGQSILRANDADHARIRRVFSHAFSDRALKEQEPLLRQYVDLLVKKLGEKILDNSDAKIDFVSFYNFCTFDIMADLTFAESLHMLDNSTYVPWVKNAFKGIKFVFLITLLNNESPLLCKILMLLFLKPLRRLRKQHLGYTRERVNRRLATETDKPDIWSFVLRHNDEKGLTVREMDANASTLMLAGTETTATLLSGLTYHLCQNPEKMQKLVAEIRGTFKTAEEINMTSLMRLKYLDACLEEGLRIFPPVPLGLPRLVPPEGAIICGESIAGGTTVYVTNYAAYHSPRNFRQPEDFIPERWLGDPRFGFDQKAALQPFSIGPRNCLGKNLAYHEMRLILANVLWHFDLTLRQESDTWLDQRVFALWEKKPLLVKLKAAASAQ